MVAFYIRHITNPYNIVFTSFSRLNLDLPRAATVTGLRKDSGVESWRTSRATLRVNNRTLDVDGGGGNSLCGRRTVSTFENMDTIQRRRHRSGTWNKIGVVFYETMLLLRRLPGILYTHRYTFYTGIILFVTFAYLLFRWNLICSNIQAWRHVHKVVSRLLFE